MKFRRTFLLVFLPLFLTPVGRRGVCAPASESPLLPVANETTVPIESVVTAQSLNILTTATLTPAAILRLTSPAETVVLQPVTLGDVVRLTLERNLDYKIAKVNYEISEEEVKVQKGIFDLLLSASAAENHITAQGSIFNAFMGTPGGGLSGARQAAALQPGASAMQPADVRLQQEPGGNEDIQQLLDELRKIEAALAKGWESDYRTVNKMRTRTASVELSELTPLGGTVGLGYSINRTWMKPKFVNINPTYTQSLNAWILQPLPFFRNWGPTVTLSGIRLAKLSKDTQEWESRRQLLNQVAAVTSGYWDLVAAIYNAEVQRLSLLSARNLLRINEIRLKHGVGTETDVWEARAGVAARENALIRAVQAIGLAQDNLARLVRVNEGTHWKVRMIPRDQPHYEEYSVDEQKFIAEALEKRPDIQEAKLARRRAEIRRKVARNQRMPRLDLFGSYGITGLGPSTGRAGHYMGTQDYRNWSIGVDFSVPIPNTKARARYRQAKKLYEGSNLLIQQVTDLAVFEVRKAIRDLRAARDSIAANQARVRAEQEKLRGEMKRYEVGMATSQDLLDYQDYLAAAQSGLVKAIVDYNKAIIDLERARGTLLESFHINFEEPEGGTKASNLGR